MLVEFIGREIGIFTTSTFLTILVLIRVFILRASCAVADVKEPRYRMASWMALAVVAVGLAVFIGIDLLFERFTADPTILFGPLRIFGFFLSLVIGWALAALLYRLVLTQSLLRSLVVSGIELLLNGLAIALVVMVFLVGYSVWQLFWHPAPQQTPPRAAAALVFRDLRS